MWVGECALKILRKKRIREKKRGKDIGRGKSSVDNNSD